MKNNNADTTIALLRVFGEYLRQHMSGEVEKNLTMLSRHAAELKLKVIAESEKLTRGDLDFIMKHFNMIDSVLAYLVTRPKNGFGPRL